MLIINNILKSKSIIPTFTSLACHKDEHIAVSVFHEQSDNVCVPHPKYSLFLVYNLPLQSEHVNSYVKSILAEFMKANADDIKSLRSTFDKMVDDDPNPPVSFV